METLQLALDGIKSKWKELGSELGLESIIQKGQTSEDGIVAVLRKWLESGNATAESLLHALTQPVIGGDHLALMLSTKHSLFEGELLSEL